MKEKKHTPDLSVLADLIPMPYVPRNWKKWNDFIPISPRTIANEDSKGTGVKKRIIIGNVCAYEKYSLIEWLESRSKVIS